jgi:hypothetical protein
MSRVEYASSRIDKRRKKEVVSDCCTTEVVCHQTDNCGSWLPLERSIVKRPIRVNSTDRVICGVYDVIESSFVIVIRSSHHVNDVSRHVPSRLVGAKFGIVVSLETRRRDWFMRNASELYGDCHGI